MRAIGHGPEIHVQVEPGHVKQRKREHDQAKQQQPARAVAREQKSHQRQQQHDGEAAGHERQASLLRGVAEQRLR